MQGAGHDETSDGRPSSRWCGPGVDAANLPIAEPVTRGCERAHKLLDMDLGGEAGMPSEDMLAKVQAAYADAARNQPAHNPPLPAWQAYRVRSVRPSSTYSRQANGAASTNLRRGRTIKSCQAPARHTAFPAGEH